MHKKYHNKQKLKIIITTILIFNIATACTTTKHRDKAITKTLTLQNEAIDSVINSESKNKIVNKPKGKETNDNLESATLKALVAIRDSNSVLISKLKPNTKKECHCGKDERTCNTTSK